MSLLVGRCVKEFAVMFKATKGGHAREEDPQGPRTGICLPSGLQGPEHLHGILGAHSCSGGGSSQAVPRRGAEQGPL